MVAQGEYCRIWRFYCIFCRFSGESWLLLAQSLRALSLLFNRGIKSITIIISQMKKLD